MGAAREDLIPGRQHLTVTDKFQSDKYPWSPAGFVPLKTTDIMARDLLVAYAERRRAVDKDFAIDLLDALGRVTPYSEGTPENTGRMVAILRRHDLAARKVVMVPEGQTIDFDPDDATRRWLWPHLGTEWHLVEFLPLENL